MCATYTTSIDGTPTNGANPWADALVWGGAWRDDNGGTVTINYAFGSGYDRAQFNGAALNWDAVQRVAMYRALQSWESVANIDFVEQSQYNANAVFWKLSNSQIGADTLGYSEVPTWSLGAQLALAINGQHASINYLNPGAYGFVTLIHELGHLLGLAHPHDGGANYDATAFPGVNISSDLGRHDLNQGIFTTMTYNDGWQTGYPGHGSYAYGWQMGPMALDIAAIQAVYGANTGYATGDNTYRLPAENGDFTGWKCIWDAGGFDTLSFDGTRDCRIDLRAAPLTGENAGGYISYALGVVGGVTIANGVFIERALGGTGADWIIGNDGNNVLNGRGGNDTLYARNGDDRVTGGDGNDRLFAQDGDDLLKGRGGSDLMRGGPGDDRFQMSAGNDTIDGGADTDTVAYNGTVALSIYLKATEVQYTGLGAQKIKNIENVTGGRGHDLLFGNDGDNLLSGSNGHDRIFAAAGSDTLRGGLGNDLLVGGDDALGDTFQFISAQDSKLGSRHDVVRNFTAGADLIDLSQIDANLAQAGNNAFAFSGSSAAAHSVWYESDGVDALVFFDIDGDGKADSEILLVDVTALSSSDFLL